MANRDIRLTGVPEEIYLALLEFKAKEEQRLKRGCNLTDGLKRMYCSSSRANEIIKRLVPMLLSDDKDLILSTIEDVISSYSDTNDYKSGTIFFAKGTVTLPNKKI